MSDWFYRAFEDRYRGSRDVIHERLKVYLPFVAPLVQDGGAAALDLGCGRGEWLELLTEAGFAAEGVDLDEGMLTACRERGLKVVNGDALAILRARPDASTAVVSAFHLVEHIAFEQVEALIAEALRVLQPGGLLILETPNPENLVVGATSFYEDPTHLRPLSPKLLSFAVEFGGFARHNVLRLQEPAHLHGAGPVRLFDVLAGVSPDYSVVAQKAGALASLAALDPLFATTYGVDLHVLAQRHQQAQDAVRDELAHLREQQIAANVAIQHQLGEVDSQITQVNAAAVSLVAERDNKHEEHAVLARKQDRCEQDVAGLRTRCKELEQLHQDAAAESARLAQHVGWIEGRLTHSEAELALMRQHMAELLHRRASIGRRVMRASSKSLRRLAGLGRAANPRRPVYALLRRLVQGVQRRPTLKRLARRLIARFPRLHTRLLQVMYAPAAPNTDTPVHTDPLASELSPRSLPIYRALAAEPKQKD